MADYFTYTYSSRMGRIVRGAPLCCSRCNREIEPGVAVVSISAARHRKIYHQACYESLYIETDDKKRSKKIG
jgi:hypothetical protein